MEGGVGVGRGGGGKSKHAVIFMEQCTRCNGVATLAVGNLLPDFISQRKKVCYTFYFDPQLAKRQRQWVKSYEKGPK